MGIAKHVVELLIEAFPHAAIHSNPPALVCASHALCFVLLLLLFVLMHHFKKKVLDEEVRGLAEELIGQYNATKNNAQRDGTDPSSSSSSSSGEEISITVRSHTFVVTHPIARYGFRPQRKTTSARI